MFTVPGDIWEPYDSAWRYLDVMKSEYSYQAGHETKTVFITPEGDELCVTIDHRQIRVTAPQLKQGTFYFSVDGQQVKATVANKNDRWYVHLQGQQWVLTSPTLDQRSSLDQEDEMTSGWLTATMPGQVVQVLVDADEKVVQGQALIILEAMKMELRIAAPFDGVIQEIYCSGGQTVERDQPLISVAKEQGSRVAK